MQDKPVALVTGANQGIGLQIAKLARSFLPQDEFDERLDAVRFIPRLIDRCG
jgi:hypothetical protein